MQPQSQTFNISTRTNMSEESHYRPIVVISDLGTLSKRWIEGESSIKHTLNNSSVLKEQHNLQHLPLSANEVSKSVLVKTEKAVPEQAMAGLKIKQLMLHAIEQTAIASFKSDSLEIFAQDGYTMDNSGAVQSRTFVYSESLRYRVRHKASSFQTAFGCVWVRSTIIYQPGDTQRRSQSVTLLVFYPTRWIQQLGVRNGFEAIVASANRSWLFNCRLTVTRAVPEDSLIFELCRTGQTQAVRILLSRGLGSVVDTSPKGWKPLHVRTIEC